VLSPSAHGKGLATEAVTAALEWGDARFGAGRRVCIINPDNERSIRVAKRVGFRQMGRAVYRERPALVFEQ